MTEPHPSATRPLPHQTDTRFVTDAGMETDLIFHHGVELPDFAAFPLLEHESGRQLLRQYYAAFAAIAERAGAGLLLETPTWRANADWGARLGYDADALREANRAAVRFLHELRDDYSRSVAPILCSGMIGPRGDGYVSTGAIEAADAERYHRDQIEALHGAGVDLVTAYTLSEVGEAIGIVQAARHAGVAVAVSFTVETDGRLARGGTLADAIGAVDAVAPPDYYLVNCAHPGHISAALADGAWRQRILGLRANASTKSHAELDAAEELDEGDPTELAAAHEELRAQLPNLRIIGGCCGTDARHVAALWTPTPQLPAAG